MSEPVGNAPRPASPVGNSHKLREAAAPPEEEREKIDKIITGKVVVKKPNVLKRAARSMVADDVTNVGDFVVAEVFVPALRNLIYDIVSKGSHRILFGTSQIARRGVTTSGPVTSLKTAYHEARSQGEPVRSISPEAAARHSFEDISLEFHSEAIDVLEKLVARIDRYRAVTVADFYQFLGMPTGFPDRKWGWTNLDEANVRQTRDGYVFDLPRPIKLD